MKPLPVGIQTFPDLIRGGYLYVDKTRWIYDLVRYSKGVYFLARPRRSGKSLLISTLEAIFRGQRELFQGFWLYDSPYQWEPYPVIHLDFSRKQVETAVALRAHIQDKLIYIASQHQLTLRVGDHLDQFEDLIRQMSASRQVVILIDEYDKPILDNIENLAEAQQIRDVLKGFYTIIKSMDAHIRFVFLTGISKFSKVGVFSGLNNLNDISLNGRYADLLGITQSELEANFDDYLQTLATSKGINKKTLLDQIRFWYNGFCFSEDCTPVYNPFSLLLFFEGQTFRNYWFESGTPTFLIKLLRQRNYPIETLSPLVVDELAFSRFEIDDLQPIPLLYQTGYLTIKGYDPQTRLYTLAYPNYEVEHAFMQYLLGAFGAVAHSLTSGYLWQLIQALQSRDLDRFFAVLNIFFADIPYDNSGKTGEVLPDGVLPDLQADWAGSYGRSPYQSRPN